MSLSPGPRFDQVCLSGPLPWIESVAADSPSEAGLFLGYVSWISGLLLRVWINPFWLILNDLRRKHKKTLPRFGEQGSRVESVGKTLAST